MAAPKVEPLLTVADVAQALGLSEWTIRQHARQGRFDGCVVVLGGKGNGRRYRFTRAGFARWLETQRANSAA